MESKAGQHERTSKFFLARWEKRVLPRLALALPGWVMPDHLTALGFTASAGIGISYMLSNHNQLWLLAASALLVVQWFGDSLDGTLARTRKIERPRYGYYLDHITDAFATVIIGLGLGLSPYMLLSVGLAVVIAYLVLSINVYLETHVFGQFSLGYGMIGPTEVRVILLALNLSALAIGPLPFNVLHVDATVFDVAGMLVALGMAGLLLGRVYGNLKTLAGLEPPNRETAG
jgi:phosphatidylglycerophosphate synthase